MWKDRLELFLDAQDIPEVIEDFIADDATAAKRLAWRKADKKAKYYIASAVPDAFYSIVEGWSTARMMMDALENHFATNTYEKRVVAYENV